MKKLKRKPGKGVGPIPKWSRDGLLSPRRFVFMTPVSMEECVHRLEQKNRSFREVIPDMKDVRIILTEIDDDSYGFFIASRSARASGTMRRWEGTSTLLRGEVGDNYFYDKFLLTSIYILAFAFLILFVSRSWVWILASILSILIVGGLFYWNPYDRLLDILGVIVSPAPRKKKRAEESQRVKVNWSGFLVGISGVLIVGSLFFLKPFPSRLLNTIKAVVARSLNGKNAPD